MEKIDKPNILDEYWEYSNAEDAVVYSSGKLKGKVVSFQCFKREFAGLPGLLRLLAFHIKGDEGSYHNEIADALKNMRIDVSDLDR